MTAGPWPGIPRVWWCALGHTSATLVGHADGGLVCWATAVLHARVVRAIALISSPHPAASARRRSERPRPGPCAAAHAAALPGSTTAGARTDPRGRERARTPGPRPGLAAWQAGDDFRETIGHLRHAIQIPSAAHSALEYQRWAVRSQFRNEGRRFMKLMNRRLEVPLLHLRGEDDPYVLADPVERQRFAPGAASPRCRRGPLRPRGGAGRGQRTAAALPQRPEPQTL